MRREEKVDERRNKKLHSMTATYRSDLTKWKLLLQVSSVFLANEGAEVVAYRKAISYSADFPMK